MKRISYVVVLSLAIGEITFAQSTTNQGTPSASGTQSTTTGQIATDQGNKGQKNPLADLDLKQQINQKLSTLPALRFVSVDVNEGKVTLKGKVPTKADRKRAQEMAKSVAGVRKVKDKLTIDANATSSDDENEPTSAGTGTKPTETGNEGAASDSATKPEAQAPTTPPSAGAATSTGGIAGAVTGAEASKPGPTQSQDEAGAASVGTPTGSAGPSTKQPSDAASEASSTIPGMRPLADSATIQGQIEKTLRDDSTLQGSNINVRVADDLIELSGNVPTAKEKTTAWRIASSYAFNRRVKDRIVVTGRGTARPSSPVQDPNSTPAGQATPPITVPKDGSLPR